MRCCIIPIAAHGLQFFDPTVFVSWFSGGTGSAWNLW